MALHNLKITVIDGGRGALGGGGGGEDGEGEEKKPNPRDSRLYKILNYNQSIRNSIKKGTSPATFFAIQQGISVATQTARQFVNYYVSNIGREHGDSNYQAIINRRIEIGTDGLSIFGGALNGAAAGSIAGGYGAAIGAVIGAASAGISLGFKYAGRERAYQHEMFKENNSQAYQLARSNYTAMTGRVR